MNMFLVSVALGLFCQSSAFHILVHVQISVLFTQLANTLSIQTQTLKLPYLIYSAHKPKQACVSFEGHFFWKKSIVTAIPFT